MATARELQRDAWHLGHQPAVAHFMVRNLTAAEASLDAELEALMDAATGEPDRGDLPTLDRIVDYRDAVAERVHFRVTPSTTARWAPLPSCGSWSGRCWWRWSTTSASRSTPRDHDRRVGGVEAAAPGER